MYKLLLPCLLICLYPCLRAQAQGTRSIHVTVLDEKKNTSPGSSVYLLTSDSVIIRSGAASATGNFEFNNLGVGRYLVRVNQSEYETGYSHLIDLEKNTRFPIVITLKPRGSTLEELTVVSMKPLIQFLPDKTVINPDANITNAGATVMDILEKSPGITVGKDGSIIMKGKPAVTVLIDGKPTQLSGADLQAYLSGISGSQVESIELIENPGARYDASGNAGIINIKTKSNRQKGFNGSLNLSLGQGIYSKTGNSINLNYRNGKTNWFLNYGVRVNKEMQDLYTLRKYFDRNGEDSLLLEQPNISRNKNVGHNIKTGFDYFISSRTTAGLVFTGGIFEKRARSSNTIDWMDPEYKIDSSINTRGENNLRFRRGGVNLNLRHKINENSDLTADLDYVKFAIDGDQNYETQLVAPGSIVSATKGNIPSRLDIITAKIDYTRRFKQVVMESGLKTAINKTDNLAEYYYADNNNWQPDLSRSNHFLYDERISAAYTSIDAEQGKWHWQAGLRYEITSYKAHQLGNAIAKDSAFNRNYSSLFPTAFISYQADSNHMFTFRTGRRIDRPAFQNLNPFLTTLNKYTYEGGNPFIKPQYTWNFAIAHTYKQMLTTEVSYSYLSDYFSQIFIIDSNSSNVNKNIIIYTRGNVGSFQNFGITETFQLPVKPWWNLTAVAVFNYKIIKGVIWAPLKAEIGQLNVSLNNQFRLSKGWGFEVSGYYQTRSQIDLQEWLTPQGELNLGISKQVLKEKGSLKLNVRDLTYFQNYSGQSTFQNAYEPFVVKWDSRVVRLSFSWRFGKAFKQVKRSEGGATDEIDRAGNGN
ncbi:MAG: outer membrane beta-barrel protein [Chitinophagaceae bacterium]